MMDGRVVGPDEGSIMYIIGYEYNIQCMCMQVLKGLVMRMVDLMFNF